MHPRLKKVDEPSKEKPGLDSPDPRLAKDSPDASTPQVRKQITAEKFAYLRAQVQVFRRSH
jgi:hypothetical protein